MQLRGRDALQQFHLDFTAQFSKIYPHIYIVGRVTPFSFVCKKSNLKQSAAACEPGHNESTLHLTQQDSSVALFFQK